MKIYIFIVVMLLNVTLYAQIKTTIFPDGKGFETFPMLNQIDKEKIPTYEVLSFNLDSIIKEENYYREVGGFPFRFGYAFDVDYGIGHGKWFEVGEKRVWSIRFRSEGAYSLNFGFSDLKLGDKSELYVYNPDGTVINGPITSKNNSTDEFKSIGSDLIAGEEAIIQVIEPKASIQNSTIKIIAIVHGFENYYKDILSDNDKGGNSFQTATLNCHIDVACKPDWENESRGIGLIMLNNWSYWCSGALLNNQLGTNRPYFLTAFHCADSDNNASLSGDEKSATENWWFRFNYKKNICNENSFALEQWYYSGAYFRASLWDTDFLLLELKNAVKDPNIRFLGWDALPLAALQGICIHHPEGDPMKISIDNSTVDLWGNLYIWEGFNISPAYTHLDVYFDEGAVEGGSSGAPLFDQNHRIKGQLHGGIGGCGLNQKLFGSFFMSFGGGGTDNNRLINWLSPYSPVSTQTNTTGLCQSTNFFDKVVNVEDRIICNKINVKNVTVKAGKSLVLEGGSTRIFPHTVIESGSKVVITK